MDNPFKVRGLAQNETFFNRSVEIKELLRRLLEGQHTLLLAPRRMGKTSLLRRVLVEFNKNNSGHAAFIDLFLCSSLSEFLRLTIDGLFAPHRNSAETFFRKISKSLPRLVPKLVFSASGESEASLGTERSLLTFDDLAETLQWFDNQSKKNVIVLDEIQELTEFPEHESIEKKLRALIQTLKNTTIIYSGSSPSILREMFSKRSRAFFQSALLYEIGFADRNDAFNYITKQLSASKVPSSVVESIISISHGHPYYTQLTGYVAFELYRKNKDWNLVFERDIFQEVIYLERATFEATISPLTTIQKQVYRAICRASNQPILAAEFIRTHHLSGASSVRAAAQKLEAIGLIIKSKKEGYYPSDPLLARWWAWG